MKNLQIWRFHFHKNLELSTHYIYLRSNLRYHRTSPSTYVYVFTLVLKQEREMEYKHINIPGSAINGMNN